MSQSSRMFSSIHLTQHGGGYFIALAIADDGTAWTAQTSAVNGHLKVDSLTWKQVDPLPGQRATPGKLHTE